MKSIPFFALAIMLATASCNKSDNPEPMRSEAITTPAQETGIPCDSITKKRKPLLDCTRELQ